MADERTISDFSAVLPDGTRLNLAEKAGKVLLVVNTASKCGFTPQYDGLEALWRKYRDRGFEVIGFPCNQFGAQEPGTAEDIAAFCSLTFDITFPLMAKVDVNGTGAIPLYRWLKREAPGVLGTEAVKWNFTKFLVSPDGQTVTRYAPTTEPADLRPDIEAMLVDESA